MTESTHTADRIRRWVRSAVVVSVFAVGAVACGSSSPTSTADLDAAISTMISASSYSFTATVTAGNDSVRIVGDFQAPNLIAETVTKGSTTPVSMVLEGGTVHVRNASTGTWSSKPTDGTAAVDLRSTFAALTTHSHISHDGNTWNFTVSGDAAKVLAGADITGDAKVTATVDSGALTTLRYEVTTGGRRLVVTIDYSEIGTAPKVVVPA